MTALGVVTIFYVIIPVNILSQQLFLADNEKLKQEFTVHDFLKGYLYVPNSVGFLLYISSSAYMVYLLMKSIVLRRSGFNCEIRHVLIRRVYLALIVLVYEVPYLMNVLKRLILFFLNLGGVSEYDESSFKNEWRNYLVAFKVLYIT